MKCERRLLYVAVGLLPSAACVSCFHASRFVVRPAEEEELCKAIIGRLAIHPTPPLQPQRPPMDDAHEHADPSPTSSLWDRQNTTPEALGKIRRIRLFGAQLYLSPGWWAILITATVTALIVLANVYAAWQHIGSVEYSVLWVLLAVAHVSSLCLITSDPGVYPRLLPEETDPLGQNMELVFCRVCRMRRPPRTSHCYDCNVCVLDHDHHCQLLGACVGTRNLRWFTLYLLTISIATLMGLLWQLRYAVSLAIKYAFGQPLVAPAVVEPSSFDGDDARFSSAYFLFSLCMLLVDVAIVGIVGLGAVYYALLTLTDTTRRESQRREMSMGVFMKPRLLLYNLKKTAFPPPSLVEQRGPSLPEDAERGRLV